MFPLAQKYIASRRSMSIFPKNFALQPRQPLPGILDFGQAGVGVFPEVEEALELYCRFSPFPLRLAIDGDRLKHFWVMIEPIE